MLDMYRPINSTIALGEMCQELLYTIKYHVYYSLDFSMLNAAFVSSSGKAVCFPAYSIISSVLWKVFQAQKSEISKLVWIFYRKVQNLLHNECLHLVKMKLLMSFKIYKKLSLLLINILSAAIRCVWVKHYHHFTCKVTILP